MKKGAFFFLSKPIGLSFALDYFYLEDLSLKRHPSTFEGFLHNKTQGLLK